MFDKLCYIGWKIECVLRILIWASLMFPMFSVMYVIMRLKGSDIDIAKNLTDDFSLNDYFVAMNSSPNIVTRFFGCFYMWVCIKFAWAIDDLFDGAVAELHPEFFDIRF